MPHVCTLRHTHKAIHRAMRRGGPGLRKGESASAMNEEGPCVEKDHVCASERSARSAQTCLACALIPAWRGRQCSLASRRQVWCLLSAAIRLLGITRGVSIRVRGQSSPHRAKQRLSPGRARDHPVMEIVPNKCLSLSLSLHEPPRQQWRPVSEQGEGLAGEPIWQ